MAKLIQQLDQDPEEALRFLIARYGGLVRAVAQGVLGKKAREEVEECVSDVFLDVYQKRFRLSDTNMKAYLCAVARGKAVDRARRLGRVSAVPMEEAERIPSAGNVESAAEEKLLREKLIQEIGALGEPDSSIVLLRYYFDMSSREIAKQLRLSPAAVDQRLSRARKRLRVTMKGE